MDFSPINEILKPGKKLDDRELARAIRLSISAEHDAVHLYELIADSTDNVEVKKIMQDIADEEKVHVGEFEELLNMIDEDNEDLVEDGRDEAAEIIDEIVGEYFG